MSKVHLSSLFSVAALFLGLTIPAAATTVSITAGPWSPVSGVSTTTFDSGLPSNFSTTGSLAGTRTGSLLNVYMTPTGDTTPYAYVGPNSSITETLAPGTDYVGFYWGSPDYYNTVTFTNASGGTEVWGLGGTPVPGLVTDQLTAAYVGFWDTGAAWTSITWTTGGPAFEFDNVSTSSATPEPASIFLLAGGLVAVGAGALRRRRSA